MNEPRSTCPEASPPIAASSPSLPIDSSASQGASETPGKDHEQCSECDGTGIDSLAIDYTACDTCAGTGRSPTWRELYDRETERAWLRERDLRWEVSSLRGSIAAQAEQIDRASAANRQLYDIALRAQATVREAVSRALDARDAEHAADMAEVLRLLSASGPCDQARHGAAKDHDEVWQAMRLVGVQRDEYEGDLELRDCPACRSTIARHVDPGIRAAHRATRAISREMARQNGRVA